MCDCGDPLCKCYLKGLKAGAEIGEITGYGKGFNKGFKEGLFKGIKLGVDYSYNNAYYQGYTDRQLGLAYNPDKYKIKNMYDIIAIDPRSWWYRKIGPTLEVQKKYY